MGSKMLYYVCDIYHLLLFFTFQIDIKLKCISKEKKLYTTAVTENLYHMP